MELFLRTNRLFLEKYCISVVQSIYVEQAALRINPTEQCRLVAATVVMEIVKNWIKTCCLRGDRFPDESFQLSP
jgi:hypothetical protein